MQYCTKLLPQLQANIGRFIVTLMHVCVQYIEKVGMNIRTTDNQNFFGVISVFLGESV